MAERNEGVPEQFVFEEEAGLVPVSLLRENGAVIGAELLAPEPLSRRTQVPPERAAACLSLTAEERSFGQQCPLYPAEMDSLAEQEGFEPPVLSRIWALRA
jgi:trans-2,3-dihydro-3-hydroxyanthranilate isomerase